MAVFKKHLKDTVLYQHLPRGANWILRDGDLTPFRNHFAPFGRSRYVHLTCFGKRCGTFWYHLGMASLRAKGPKAAQKLPSIGTAKCAGMA